MNRSLAGSHVRTPSRLARIVVTSLALAAAEKPNFIVINIDDPRLRWIEQQVLRQLGDRIYPANGGHRGVLR